MFIPAVPTPYEGGIRRFPQIWHDTTLPDGDRSPWINAPVGSLYVRVGDAPALFQKVASTGADTDWRGGSDGTINVLDYGADPTGVTGSGAAINAAIAAAIASRYGRVYIPQGKYIIDETIVLHSLIWLQGAGYATLLVAAGGLDAPVIDAYYETDVGFSYMQRISDLRIDGNRENQTNSTTSIAHGIRWQAPTSSGLPLLETELIGTQREVSQSAPGQWFDSNRDAFNLWISYCGGDGFICTGRGGIHLDNIVTYENAGYGFTPTYDTQIVNCVAARNGKVGFNASVSSLRLVGCKAWWSGYRPPSGWSNEFSHGFIIQSQGISLVGCEAQDNYAHGFYFNNAYGNVASGCIADSNNRRQADDVGVAFKNSWGNAFEGLVWDRYNDDIRYQPHALHFEGSVGNNTIRIKHRLMNGGVTNEASQYINHYSDTTTTTLTRGNEIVINNYNGTQVLSGSAPTPSVYHGRFIRVNVDSNLTFGHSTSTIIHDGAEMVVTFFMSGAGGYTVSFAPEFDLGSGFAVSGTVGHYSTIRFSWTGAKWVKTGEMIGV